MQNKHSWIIGILALGVGIVFTHIYDTRLANGRMQMDNTSMSMSMGNMHKMPDGSVMRMSESKMSMDAMMTSMTANLQGKSGKELEKAFLTEMIPHHQGAVAMANVLLADKTISPQLRAFAEKIVAAQTGEIAEMKEWLKSY
jgi:uncharacterized protein (DUF305 family)